MLILIEILKIINVLLLGVIIYYFVNLLIQQYYSYPRMIRALFSHAKYYLLALMIVDGLSILFYKHVSFYFYHIISSIIWIIIFGKSKFSFSRRKAMLFLLCSFLVISLSYFFSFLLSFKLFSFLFFILISLVLLSPIETLIREHYIKKAKKRLADCNNLKIIGITGSFGKSSFRNYLYEILRTKYDVKTPPRNINTLMGITKYINNDFEDCDILILELGIDQKNQMKRFNKLFKLDDAIITSIGNMHLASFKSIDNVIKEKLKIKDLLKDSKNLYLNFDNQYLNKIERKDITFFSKKNIELIKYDINGLEISFNDKSYLFSVHQIFFTTYLDGIIKISKKYGFSEENVYQNSFIFKDYERRNQVFLLDNGYLIDNSYNANLEGIKSSLILLDTLSGTSFIITGGIIEQGKNFALENQKLAKLFENRNIIFVGEKTHPLIKNHKFKKLIITKNINSAYKLIRDIKPNNVLLLSKGENIFLR